MKYTNLHVVRVDREGRSRTCGYWYLVTSNNTSHCAFRTRRALDLWMRERGLSLSGPLDEPHAHCSILGEYSRVYDSPEHFATLEGTPIISLSNGDYGPGLITSSNGHKTEHVEHGNGRRIYDYRKAQSEIWQDYEENEAVATAPEGR